MRRLTTAANAWCARTRAKNEVHGVLARNLRERSPVAHLFTAGHRWLAELGLPVDERLTLEGRHAAPLIVSTRSRGPCARSPSSALVLPLQPPVEAPRPA